MKSEIKGWAREQLDAFVALPYEKIILPGAWWWLLIPAAAVLVYRNRLLRLLAGMAGLYVTCGTLRLIELATSGLPHAEAWPLTWPVLFGMGILPCVIVYLHDDLSAAEVREEEDHVRKLLLQPARIVARIRRTGR